MSESTPSNDMILGQILGEIKGLNNAMGSISTTFAAHALSDKESFEQLRRQMIDDKKEQAEMMKQHKKEQDEARNFIAKVTGALILLASVASYLVPYILSRL